MIRPYKSRGKSAGIAIVAVLISAVVFLGIIVAITGTLSLSSRQSTSDQRVTLEAQYASESGLSRVMAESISGVLKTWTSVMLNITTSNSMNTAGVQRLAKLFCNYPTSQALALPSATTVPADFAYCPAQPGADVTDRFELFTSALAPVDYTKNVLPAIDGTAPTSDALEVAFWKDVFSDGPSGARYSKVVSDNASYNVSFGLQAIGVNILNGSVYRFRFKARDAVSTGRYMNGTTVVSKRVSQRDFSEEYYIDIAPPKLSYFLSLTNAQGPVGGNSGAEPVYFTGKTLLDGPVHTNGAYYFRGNPWLSGEVTSAGCTGTYTTDSTTLISTCSQPAVVGYYNDAAVTATPLVLTIDSTTGKANFSGYKTSALATDTAPEFAYGNTVAKGKPNPWDYTGKYDADIVTLPTLSTEQRGLAEASGILLETKANPAVDGYYNNSETQVLMQATGDARGISTSFATVPVTGKPTIGQIIQMRVNKKIERCNAVSTGIVISPKTGGFTAGIGRDFTATVSGQDTYTITAAPTIRTVTWSMTPGTYTGTQNSETAPTATAPARAKYTWTSTSQNPNAGSVTVTARSIGTAGRTDTATLNADVPNPAVDLVLTASGNTQDKLSSNGGSIDLKWDVFNRTEDRDRSLKVGVGVGIAGIGPYNYQIQYNTTGPYNTNDYINIGSPRTDLTGTFTVTRAMAKARADGKIWFKMIARNSVTLKENSDWELVTVPGGTTATPPPSPTPSPPSPTPPPPAPTTQSLDGLSGGGKTTARAQNSGVVNPNWQVAPIWGGSGTQPSITYSIVGPNAQPMIASVDSSTGRITLNFTGSVTAYTDVTFTVRGTPSTGLSRDVTFTVTVNPPGAPASVRPHARLTQSGCTAGGPEAYPWAHFVDYYIDIDNNIWKREYPAATQNATSRPLNTNAAWEPSTAWNPTFGKFNGVVYVDGKVSVQGPKRTVAGTPDSAPPTIAYFAAITLATDSKLRIIDDIKYEKPVCSLPPSRDSTTKLVTPATCTTTQGNWARNVLGLYSSSTDGIEIETTQVDTTIQAISLASQGKIQVANLPVTANDGCSPSLRPDKVLKNINIQGGLIQSSYGQFGKFNSDNTTTCGYDRTMTYDIRMKDPKFAPPGFPNAPNAKPTFTLTSSSNPNKALTVGQSLPLPAGFSRSK